jgi:hypothetical protein
MSQKLSANQIFFTLLGVAVVAACAFLLIHASRLQSPKTSTPNVVLPAQNPYTFSTSSPLVITETTQHVSGMGNLVNYTGTLPATGSCEEINTQAPTYGTNPVRFAFIINTTPEGSCTDPSKPLTFSVGFGADSKGNTPALSEVFVNGSKVIYTVNGN